MVMVKMTILTMTIMALESPNGHGQMVKNCLSKIKKFANYTNFKLFKSSISIKFTEDATSDVMEILKIGPSGSGPFEPKLKLITRGKHCGWSVL